MNAKEAAARKAVEFVQDGMKLGLGTGSTSAYMIQALGERVKKEGLKVRGVPTSERSRLMAIELGISILDLNEAGSLDLAIDGADEVDRNLNLIKGGGGALLQEKLVAAAAKEFIVICDEGKMVNTLGQFPLPVAIIPFGWKTTAKRIEAYCPNYKLRMSKSEPDHPFVTDDGLYILDLQMGSISDPVGFEKNLKLLVGVAEVGLFCNMARRVIVGDDTGKTEIINA